MCSVTTFHAYRDAYLCMQAEGQTEGQGETDKQHPPTPIPGEKRYSNHYKCYLVLVLLKVHFLEKYKDSWAIFVVQ